MKILGRLFRKKKTGYLTMSNKPTKKRKKARGWSGSPLDYCSMLFAVLLVISVIKIDESKARERKRTHENHLLSQSGCVRVHF